MNSSNGTAALGSQPGAVQKTGNIDPDRPNHSHDTWLTTTERRSAE